MEMRGTSAWQRGVYVGRVNTARRICPCRAVGADSFDGLSVSRSAANLLKLENARQELDWTILMRGLLAAVYVGAMVAANLLVWLSPCFSLIDSVLLIGLDLTLRDVMDERLSRAQLAAVIVGGGAIIWLANPAPNHIAIASAKAFILAALADWLAYSLLRSRPWMVRCNGSNVVGAAVDSVIFPMLAFGAFPPATISLQFAAKVGGGAIWSVLLRPLVRPGG
jgi:queuosine precursor transporter